MRVSTKMAYSPLIGRSLQTRFVLLLVFCFLLSIITLITFLIVSPLFKSCANQKDNDVDGIVRKNDATNISAEQKVVIVANDHSELVDTDLVTAGSTQHLLPIQRPLRIAQIAPLTESVPPKMYGGTERIVYYLTEELVSAGHQVTLFASSDSNTSARQFGEWSALRLNPSTLPLIPYLSMLDQVRIMANEFDILHFHILEHFNIVHDFLNRSVTTMHGKLNSSEYVPFLKRFNTVPLVSISDDQRTHLNTTANFLATVYHGIPKNLLPFTDRTQQNGGPYLAFIGRISPEKRPEWAIQIAVKAGIPLKVAAKVDAVDKQFWKRVVKPLVDKHVDIVEYIGEINDEEKGRFLGNALALLFPIDWFEPFGLVMIESMACGTPVIARRMGSVPEVIDEGVTGILFDTIDEGVEAAKKAGNLDRAAIRQTFERRWTSTKMAENYLNLYEKMLTQQN